MLDRVAYGTSTAATTSTLSDTALADTGTSRLGKGWLNIVSAAAIGEFKPIVSYTAPGSAGLIQVPSTSLFSQAPSGSNYYVSQMRNMSDYLQALRQAQMLIARTSFVEQEDRSTVLGSVLNNGTFYQWTTFNVPDSWVNSGGTVVQESTQVRASRFSALVTAGGSFGRLSQNVNRIGRFFGRTLQFTAWVYSTNGGGLVQAQVLDGIQTINGVNQYGSQTHSGLGWDRFQASIAVSTNATQLTARVTSTPSNPGIIFYVGYFDLIDAYAIGNEYDINSALNLTAIEGDMYVGGGYGSNFGYNNSYLGGGGANNGGMDNFNTRLPATAWKVLREPTRRLKLDLKDSAAYTGRILWYRGWKAQNDLTAASVSWTGNPTAVLYRAKEYLLARAVRVAAGNNSDAAALAAWTKQADEMEKRFQTPLPTGVVLLEVN